MRIDIGAPIDAEDEQRFAEWIREHSRAVREFLMALVRRADLSEDLCQEVFCRAWQKRRSYRDRGHSRAYLFRIADRVVCDAFRRGRPEANLDERGWKRHEPVSRGDEPSYVVARAEEAQHLASALDCLSPLQRRVLLLRYYGQMTFAEIAETVGCPLNTALSHCYRGLGILRTMLVDRGE